jgi:hypothetical protein
MNKTKQLAVALTVAGVGICSMVSAAPLQALAAGPVASYVLAPSPIAASGTLAANATVTVTLTAEDATTAPVPGATVFVAFKHSTGGGSALVGTTVLKTKAQSFVTDTSGHVTITYHTPATLPANGEDAITAENAASMATIKATDHYTYVTVKKYGMSPHPIAATATLAPNTIRTVTLTALNSSHVGIPGAIVYVSFSQATGGGSAAVGTKALTASPQAFTAISSGVITITYKTPTVNPTTGVDTITARNAPTHSIIVANDTYTF